MSASPAPILIEETYIAPVSAVWQAITDKVHMRRIELFPQDNPAFTRESCQAGWDYFFWQSLKGYLADAK